MQPFLFRRDLPQSVALSGLAIAVELMGLAILLHSRDPTFRTVVSGTLVRAVAVLQQGADPSRGSRVAYHFPLSGVLLE
jgi:hypothetical protein